MLGQYSLNPSPQETKSSHLPVFHGQTELQKSTHRAWKGTFEIKQLFRCFFSALMQGEGIFQIKLKNGHHLLISSRKVIIKIS